MLQAINRGKSNIYRRYLGHREKGERRVHEEDELTALLLGPLAFMPENLMAAFWGALLIDRGAPDFPEELPARARMSFWPSRPDDNGGRVEPDLHVNLEWASGESRLLLLELKWRASLSGDNQLHRQWQVYLIEEERQNAVHLFIAPDTSEAIKALESEFGDVWKGRLLEISWFDILCFLQSTIPKDNQEFVALRPWVQEMICLLDKLGIRPFKGFNGFGKLSHYSQSENTLFWRGFTGFEHLSVSYHAIQRTPLFFQN